MGESTTSREGGTSSDYWRSMDGALYEELIREREGNANQAYQQQEAFLTRFVLAEKARLGRPVRILEFGCGFGRHARYLADLEGVSYAGYDFSEKMIEPLRARPPRGVDPDNLFVGADVESAVAGRRFDLVFTVSVLIHNPPEKVPALIESMARLLEPGGAVCLVENQMVPVSVFENMWHQGCWLQSYTEHVRSGLDLHVGQGLVDTHDVYLLRPNGGIPTRHFRLQDGAPLSRTELQAMSVAKISAWAKFAQRAVAQGGSALSETRLYEAQELLRAERRRAQTRKGLATLADDLASLRAWRSDVEKREAGAARAPAPAAEKVAAPAFVWDDPADVHWTHRDSRFSRVVHVYHQQWHGIRASAAYKPGQKLAITAERTLRAGEHADLIRAFEERLVRVAVFHGYSETADDIAQVLRRAFGGAISMYAVWHGNTSQLHGAYEVEALRRVLRSRSEGLLRGIGCVKPGMHLVDRHIFPEVLLCMPPLVEAGARRSTGPRTALLPVPNDWRKNFYTNLFAAQASPRISRVLVTAEFVPVSRESADKVLRVPRPDRAQMFRLMRESDVVLNASLSECQPMTAVEGLALGTPCLTGPLGLGSLDAHPYQRLVQVRAVDSVAEVRDAIEAVLDARDQRGDELGGMMADYSRILCAEALRRDCEFLQP
ncbi:MAG TPA: methyltransferase domain-containing protein [Myxococcales bacterium]|nr:methyltransferase domain-containing protein [Myxococcales bacterium]